MSGLSVFAVATTLGSSTYLVQALFWHTVRYGPAGVTYSVLGWNLVCLWGWIFALPLIAAVRTVRARNFPLWLLTGGSVGPLVVTMMLLVDLFWAIFPLGHFHRHYASFPTRFFYVRSLAASGLSSLVYLTLFLRAQRKDTAHPIRLMGE